MTPDLADFHSGYIVWVETHTEESFWHANKYIEKLLLWLCIIANLTCENDIIYVCNVII